MPIFRTLDGRPTMLNANNLVERLSPTTPEAFIEKYVGEILSRRPQWTRESSTVVEAERRYREFMAKMAEGDDVFFFQTPKPMAGFLIIRVVEDEPRIVTAILTEHP